MSSPVPLKKGSPPESRAASPSPAEWRQIIGEARREALKYFVNHDGSGCVDGLTAQEAMSIGFYTAIKRWEARQRQ